MRLQACNFGDFNCAPFLKKILLRNISVCSLLSYTFYFVDGVNTIISEWEEMYSY